MSGRTAVRAIRVAAVTGTVLAVTVLAACSSSHETSAAGPDGGERVEPSVSVSPHGVNAAPNFSTPQGPSARPTGDLSKGYEVTIDELTTGDCYNYGEASEKITLISCDLPHRYEITGVTKIEGDPDYYTIDVYGQSPARLEGHDQCMTASADYMGREPQPYEIGNSLPNEDYYLGGYRDVLCVYRTGEDLTASVKAS